MTKKVVFVANVLSIINAFHLPYMKWFKGNGYTVHVLTNANGEEKPVYCDKLYDAGIQRSTFSPASISILRKLRMIFSNENYDIVHYHTLMGREIGRLAATDLCKKGCIVDLNV